ncbi:hypothetical protein KEM52_000082 [Ascosphaera acerosa]|nr:hypothetical protein KEM52_000082 [Ascosphaera acerosa]
MTAIPPVPARVLSSNPQFRALYAQLTGETDFAESTGKPALLRPDATTRALAEEQEAAAAELHDGMLLVQRRRALINALRKVLAGGHNEAQLSPDAHGLLAVILLYLQSETRASQSSQADGGEHDGRATGNDSLDEAATALEPEIAQFEKRLHEFVPATRSTLEADVGFLRDMATAPAHEGGSGSAGEHDAPGREDGIEHDWQILSTAATSGREGTAPPRAHLDVGDDSSETKSPAHIIEARQAKLRDTLEVRLPRSRRKLASLTIALMEAHAELLEASLLLLARGKHGTLARAQKARAELLRTDAASVDTQAQLRRAEALAQIYTSDVCEALVRYQRHLLGLEDDLQMHKQQCMAQKRGPRP